ncbi:MAG: phosphoribosylaminoimidazolecarboxamide formyltransferase [Robiginitomaculum sp.]|nr:MAG: phosphoribosylaminoimidazolecarboxamide formyltransferase [Robiginitomaculum sp.]
MTDEDDLPKASDELERLAARLEVERRQAKIEQEIRRTATSALGGGFRIAVEMLAALAVGTGLGYMADRMLGTLPWIMVAGIFLGFAAGMRNMIRSAERMHAKRDGEDDKTG